MTIRSTCARAALPLLLGALSGCSALGNCPPDGEDVTIETNVADKSLGYYQSAPWYGPRDKFPAKTFVHFVHDLGFVPETVNSYVSFASTGSDFSENTGNQGRWKCIDDYEIVIKNDTCEEDFFIIVTASGSGTQHAPCTCQERSENGGGCP